MPSAEEHHADNGCRITKTIQGYGFIERCGAGIRPDPARLRFRVEANSSGNRGALCQVLHGDSIRNPSSPTIWLRPVSLRISKWPVRKAPEEQFDIAKKSDTEP